MAGLNGIAHPADGMVELATRLGREVTVSPACCSMAVGNEVMALDPEVKADLRRIIESEPMGRGLAGVRVVAAAPRHG